MSNDTGVAPDRACLPKVYAVGVRTSFGPPGLAEFAHFTRGWRLGLNYSAATRLGSSRFATVSPRHLSSHAHL